MDADSPQEHAQTWEMDYSPFVDECSDLPPAERVEYLERVLPYYWRQTYREMSRRPTDVADCHLDTFIYMLDFYDSLSNSQHPDYDPKQEGRLVIAFGKSAPKVSGRDDGRLRGWLGPTETYFGNKWDKGHFIAHSMGGAVKGCELNVFPQLRALNRGRSKEGKKFVAMEKYCRSHAGTFCFHRPFYSDGTLRPAKLEFGFIDQSGNLHTAIFDNRSS